MKPLIFCVEDEENLRIGLVYALKRYLPEFEVQDFGDPKAAMAAVDPSWPPKVLLSDFAMPGVNGIVMTSVIWEKLASAKKEKPFTIIFSAWDQSYINEQCQNDETVGKVDRFLEKDTPYSEVAKIIGEHFKV